MRRRKAVNRGAASPVNAARPRVPSARTRGSAVLAGHPEDVVGAVARWRGAAATNRKSDSRLMYLSASAPTRLAVAARRGSPSGARPAGTRCARGAAPRRPASRRAGRRSCSGGSSRVRARRSRVSRRSTWLATMRSARRGSALRHSGVARSAPRSNRSFWMRASIASRRGLGAVCRRARPIAGVGLVDRAVGLDAQIAFRRAARRSPARSCPCRRCACRCG